ncbi:hypothetical protein [Photobacterium damselae]|uniref:hypothetical protein n=1 Tax=Photobacterium damselae TaxID=38293 RepID=UPI001F237F7B|nr:hypothetical protein [Photobacterium damselae]UKA04930.1 hypothetical protein IHC89_22050 [Photobacterium damselae subsp. damselae]
MKKTGNKYSNLDTIKINPSLKNFQEDPVCEALRFDIIINGDVVGSYVDFFAFLHSKWNFMAEWWGNDVPQNERPLFSSFEPFTCSCGVSGCAGIFQGISSKHRKHTVEWTIPVDAGYEKLLKKRFYRFDTALYEMELANVVKWMMENKDKTVFYGDDDEQTVGRIIEDHITSSYPDVEEVKRNKWVWLKGLIEKYC